MLISEEDKIEILKNVKLGNKLKSIEILKSKYGIKLQECINLLDKIENENNSEIGEEENDIIKNELNIFLKQVFSNLFYVFQENSCRNRVFLCNNQLVNYYDKPLYYF